MRIRRSTAAAVSTLALSFSLAACGSDDTPDATVYVIDTVLLP